MPRGSFYGKGAKRHRKLLIDTIYGITKTAIARLAHYAGIKAMSGMIYEEFRGMLKYEMEPIIKDIATFIDHARRRTVHREDVLEALNRRGIKVYATGDEAKTKACKDYDSRKRGGSDGGSVKKSKSKSDVGPKKRKAKRGNHALREIRYYQKQYDCVFFTKLGFSRLSREIMQDFKTDVKWSSNAMVLLQMTIEERMRKLLYYANLAAIHAGRQTVSPKDLQLVRHILVWE